MNPGKALHVAAEPVLMLDELVVAETEHCRQSFHAPVKDPANPIITATEPWEGRGPYTWGSRLLRNPDTGQYDLFYIAFRAEGSQYRCGLAVSSDGLTWTKPDLRIESFEGAPARNLLPGGGCPMDRGAVQTRQPCRVIVRDPRPGCPPSQRYKGIYFTYHGECVSYSPDGRGGWKEDPANPVWGVPSDVIHAMWDPVRERFAAYYKVWEVSGETPDPGTPTGFRPVIAHFPTFDHRLREDGLTELRGPRVLFRPESEAKVEDAVLLLRTANQGIDDGGGAPLTGAWHARRVTGWAESDDWRHWRGERVVLRCDERDRPDANIQNTFVIPYGCYYLGFLAMHDERGHFEQQFAFSRDGLQWSRPWRGNFIGLGPPGAFDSGMALSPTDPIVTDTQLIFYYGGFNTLHHLPADAPWSSAIGRAALRRDGFASWDSLPESVGTIVTQPLATAQDAPWVNADARRGRLTVEVLDERGATVPRFEAGSCVPVTEDTSRYNECRAPMRWKSGASIGALRPRPFRLRFRLEQARLFSFGFRGS